MNNTFGDRHNYLLTPDPQTGAFSDIRTGKQFYVSPFYPVKGWYRFNFNTDFSAPRVRIDYLDNGRPQLNTAIWGRSRTFSTSNLLSELMRQPLLTFGVLFRIHWQALRLWRKGDLVQAQKAKYQHMLDHIEAKPGDSVLEIGCGWGGFAEYAAGQGVRVHGVTLSKRQLDYARERVSQAGLEDLASFELRDYRDLEGQYDHIVSIEMLEAVGEAYWSVYFDKLRGLLRPGGKVAIQTIIIDDAHFERYRKTTDFIQQYIFPGGMLPSRRMILKLVAKHGFQIGRIETFGADYAETLRLWRQRFEDNLSKVRELGFGSAFIRLWRFYFAYCEVGFDAERIDVVQFQLTRETES